MRRRALSLLSLLALAGACGDDSAATLIVEVRTDLVPVREFAVADVEVRFGDQVRVENAAALAGSDWLSGTRVAELDGVPLGRATVQAALRDTDNAVIVRRSVVIDVQGDQAVTIVLTRDCRTVSCPGPMDGASETECLGGVCVESECRGDASCGECASSSDCAGEIPACASFVCAGGACLVSVADASCAAGERCDPDLGCVPSEPTDGGVMDGGDILDGGDVMDGGGGGDSGADAGSGCGDCDDGVDCTVDTCVESECQNLPDDARCMDDGNPCTIQRCDTMLRACMAIPVMDTTPCDDGRFCNGPDACTAGTCISGSTNPCPGMSVCDEPGGTCIGCAFDADCPADSVGAWSACSFGDACATLGDRTRTVTTWSCMGGTCASARTPEMGSCSRTTDGAACASDGSPCTSDLCAGGVCIHPAAADNTSCGSGSGNRYACCGGTCTDLFTTDAHCGACGVACRGAATCGTLMTGPGGSGATCLDCTSDGGCPMGGSWMCGSRSVVGDGGMVTAYQCECGDMAACGGAPARCGTDTIRVCTPR